MTSSFKFFLIRWYQASDKPLPAWLQRACAADPALAAQYAAERSLTHQLRHDVRPPSVEASPYLASRVARELRPAESRSSSPLRTGFFMAALAGAMCLGLILTSRWTAPSPRVPPSETGSLAARSMPEMPALAPSNAGIFTATPGKSPGWVNPLDQEVEYMIADAKGAVRFLAASFLPTEQDEKKSG